MTKRNKTLLTILIVLLLILGTLVALVVFAARSQDSDDASDAKDETTATKEEKKENKEDEEDKKDDEDEATATDEEDEPEDTEDAGKDNDGEESDDPSTVPEDFIGNYQGQIHWPPGNQGELTKIGVTFTENSTTLTTGRDSRALKVDVDKKQTDKKRVYTEAPILEHGAKNVTWTFTPSDDGIDASYTVQGTGREDAHLTPTN